MSPEIEIIADIFKALSDPTRLQILRILESQERSVSEIVDFFSLSQPTISRHLASLANVGLIKSRKQEQQRLYSINCDNLKDLMKGYFGEFASLKGFEL
jgi:ArsR family transcriptional regulator